MSENDMTDQVDGPEEGNTRLAEVGFADFAVREHRSLWGDAWRRLLSSRAGRLGLAIVLFFVLFTVLTHFFWEYDPRSDLDYALKLKPPNLTPKEGIEGIHPFGTDKLGRDIFRRVSHGGWNSLRVGIVAVGIALGIGGLLGLVAGFYESMPLSQIGKILLFALIGLCLGSVVAWIAGQIVQVLLFVGLGVVAVLLGDLWVGKPQRIALFAGLGLLCGALPALLTSTTTAALCGLLGLAIGAIMALPLSGPLVASIIMRFMDIILAFPGILLAIAIVAMLGPGLDRAMIAIGFVGIPVYARLMRAAVLSIAQEEYVTASMATGVPQGRILFRHILPNTLSPIIVQSTMGLASAIIWAGALGFLGLGAIPPEPEWGAMLGDSYRFLTTGAWWAVVFPGLAIMISVLGFNLLGDGLRDALDPRLQV
jgi:ABC-type dipeptide/oligopeptide/nickel transport system permease subunit